MKKQKIAKLYGKIGGFKYGYQCGTMTLDEYLIKRHNLLKQIERINKHEKKKLSSISQ